MADEIASVPPRTMPLFRRAWDFVLLAVFAITCVQIYYFFGDISYYYENGLFETTQNVFLFLSAVTFFTAAWRAFDRVSKLFWLSLSVFCLCVLFREIDVRGTDFETLLGAALQLRLHYLILVLLWIALFALSFRHLGETIRAISRWLFSLSGALMVVGIIFYVAGDFAEKHFFVGDADRSEMMEESLEQLGTLFIFYSAYAVLRRPRLEP